jgi:hypothetical protein
MDVHICLEGDVTVSEGQALVTRLEGELRSAVPDLVPNIRIEDQTQCHRSAVEAAQGNGNTS